MKLRKLLVVLFVLVCVVSLACFTACKDEGAIDDGSGDQNIDAGNTDNGNNNGDVGDNTGNDNTGDNNQTPDVGGDNTGDNNENPDVGGDNTGDNNETPDVGGDNNETPDIGGDDNGDNGENPDIGGDDNGEEPETPAVVLDSISALYIGEDIVVGGTLDSMLISVNATYSDTTTAPVINFIVGDFDSTTAGVKEVTISYTEGEITKTTTINVTVVEEGLEEPEIVLDSISAVYNGSDITVNGILDSTLIFVTAYYTNGTNSAATTFIVGDFDSSVAGVKEVTISYTEGDVTKTTTISVTVVEEELEDPATLVTIYFKSENGWTNANIWAWEGQVNYTGGTWPGSAMTDLGDGWFSYTFAEDVVPTNIIFNNGSAQTADLVFDGTNNYYAFNTMTGGTWGTDNTVSAPVQESDCYLRGDVGVGENDWGIGKAMTYNGTDEYSITVTVDAGAEVKIVYQNNWIGSELLKAGIEVAIEKPAGGNIKFTEAGTYTIYYKVTGDNTGIWIAAVEAEA